MDVEDAVDLRPVDNRDSGTSTLDDDRVIAFRQVKVASQRRVLLPGWTVERGIAPRAGA